MAALAFLLGLAAVSLLTCPVKLAAAQSCDGITAEDLGNTTSPSSDGLIASILALQSGELYVDVQLLQYNLVCEATAGTRDKYRSISVVAEYLVINSSNISSEAIQSQFEFSCTVVTVNNSDVNIWEIGVSGSTGETVTTPPSATLNTTLRRDCYQCLSPERPGSDGTEIEHCLECAPSCSGLGLCTSQFPFSCCNFVTPAGTCTVSCPSTATATDDFNCECLPGYTGGDCGTNIDECSPNPCLNNGNCTDGINGFSCECPAGFTGGDCSSVLCDLACENDGTCVRNRSGVSYCECTSNFEGNLCQDVIASGGLSCGQNCFIAIIVVVVGLILIVTIVTVIVTIIASVKRGKRTGKQRITKRKKRPKTKKAPDHFPTAPGLERDTIENPLYQTAPMAVVSKRPTITEQPITTQTFGNIYVTSTSDHVISTSDHVTNTDQADVKDVVPDEQPVTAQTFQVTSGSEVTASTTTDNKDNISMEMSDL